MNIFSVIMERRLKVAGCGILLLIASASRVGAECVGFPLKHYVKYADVVFSGTIEELEQPDATRTIVTFEVDRVWKGHVGRQIVLHHALEQIDSFRLIGASTGSMYLVFATRLNARQRQQFELSERQDAFGIPICGGGTHKLDADDEMLRQLGRGRKPR